MPEREYRVWSTYTIVGEAIITASSAREAIEKGLNAHESGVEFLFSDPQSETKMRAERWPRPEPRDSASCPKCGVTVTDQTPSAFYLAHDERCGGPLNEPEPDISEESS